MSVFDWDSPVSIAAYVVTSIAVFLSVFKTYLYLTCGKITNSRNMEGKTVIITGANSGIGKETARDLAKRGARVIMACRNMETAKEARDEIIADSNNKNIIIRQLDISSLASIRIFAQQIIDTESVVDVLIHNAGVAQGFSNNVTADGLDFTMATNYYGPFLLTHLLIDMLRKSDQGRIVVVSSKLYQHVAIKEDLSNINPLNHFAIFPSQLYNLSKFAVIMFTLELARRLKGTRVTANCLHPGVINTGVWRYIPFPLNILFKPIQMCFRTAEEGARTTIQLAVSRDVEQISGQYFRGCKLDTLNKRVQDVDIQQRLWAASAELVKLQDSDPKI
ncbi:retinol dehydrogenase 14 isoform X2 [Uranotaenia lowii]|uniref:retinol dehydrogenase 14 isoform X2 n=1 Tax=Uranotaenia lowii TaxID=190385 RepID=UPI00247B2C59|nr:retinol dehydrogenase 14 isoform X2 [Uranotaenia lowii]